MRASAPLTIHICLPFKANRYMMAGKQVAHNRQTALRFRCLEGSVGMQCQRCHKVSDAKATPSVLRLSLTQPPKVGESNLFAGTFTLSLGGKRWTSHLLALLFRTFHRQGSLTTFGNPALQTTKPPYDLLLLTLQYNVTPVRFIPYLLLVCLHHLSSGPTSNVNYSS